MTQLTKEQVDALLNRLQEPEDALRFLQDAGLVDQNGELAEPYRQSPLENKTSAAAKG